MGELADTAATYFKVPIPKDEEDLTHDPQEEDNEDAATAASSCPGKAAFCAAQFKLASSSLAPDEVHVEKHVAALEPYFPGCLTPIFERPPSTRDLIAGPMPVLGRSGMLRPALTWPSGASSVENPLSSPRNPLR